ncbi:MAG: ATP-binding protein, partial [bacterium]
LGDITSAIGERQDIKSIFQVVIRTLEDHLPVDFGCVLIPDENRQSLTVTSVGVQSGELALELAMTEQAHVPVDQNGLSRCLLGHLVYEPDLTEVNFPFPQRLARGGLGALVVAPLLVESQVFGVLVLARRAKNSFSSQDCEFLLQLSGHVALAAHQAELYTALQGAYDELRQTQQAVLQQERLKALGQMASGIAHDINNAISPVVLYAESLLKNEKGLSDRARESLKTIALSADDVAATVARMREFYRQREPQLAFVAVDLNRLIGEVIELTRARWSDMPLQQGLVVKVETDLQSEMPMLTGVESELRELLTNLVFNAVDAMAEGGTLTFTTRLEKDGQAVVLEVSDTGAGMDEATRLRCFEPFYTTKGERGTGLGLAMVFGIAKRHNAEIEIDSELGKGTTMRLLFPASQSRASGADHQGEARSPRHQRILIVDDDPVLLKSLRDALESEGHLVTSANGGDQGINAFIASADAGDPYGVVITDLGMPYTDGRQVAAAVKGRSPATPVLLLTGWGQRLKAENDIPEHVDIVLDKPPKLRDLNQALLEVQRIKEEQKDVG